MLQRFLISLLENSISISSLISAGLRFLSYSFGRFRIRNVTSWFGQFSFFRFTILNCFLAEAPQYAAAHGPGDRPTPGRTKCRRKNVRGREFLKWPVGKTVLVLNISVPELMVQQWAALSEHVRQK